MLCHNFSLFGNTICAEVMILLLLAPATKSLLMQDSQDSLSLKRENPFKNGKKTNQKEIHYCECNVTTDKDNTDVSAIQCLFTSNCKQRLEKQDILAKGDEIVRNKSGSAYAKRQVIRMKGQQKYSRSRRFADVHTFLSQHQERNQTDAQDFEEQSVRSEAIIEDYYKENFLTWNFEEANKFTVIRSFEIPLGQSFTDRLVALDEFFGPCRIHVSMDSRNTSEATGVPGKCQSDDSIFPDILSTTVGVVIDWQAIEGSSAEEIWTAFEKLLNDQSRYQPLLITNPAQPYTMKNSTRTFGRTDYGSSRKMLHGFIREYPTLQSSSGSATCALNIAAVAIWSLNSCITCMR